MVEFLYLLAMFLEFFWKWRNILTGGKTSNCRSIRSNRVGIAFLWQSLVVNLATTYAPAIRTKYMSVSAVLSQLSCLLLGRTQ